MGLSGADSLREYRWRRMGQKSGENVFTKCLLQNVKRGRGNFSLTAAAERLCQFMELLQVMQII